jgi:hypothetical protein
MCTNVGERYQEIDNHQRNAKRGSTNSLQNGNSFLVWNSKSLVVHTHRPVNKLSVVPPKTLFNRCINAHGGGGRATIQDNSTRLWLLAKMIT